jgi:hypothetical protein
MHIIKVHTVFDPRESRNQPDDDPEFVLMNIHVWSLARCRKEEEYYIAADMFSPSTFGIVLIELIKQ